jgi:hypothetical protein
MPLASNPLVFSPGRSAGAFTVNRGWHRNPACVAFTAPLQSANKDRRKYAVGILAATGNGSSME